MIRQHRNKLVLWESSPSGRRDDPPRRRRHERSVARDAVGAVLLFGTIIFLLRFIPHDGDGYYRRDRVGRFMCELAGVEPGTLPCVLVVVVGWGGIVVTIGLVLKLGRIALDAVGVKRAIDRMRGDT